MSVAPPACVWGGGVLASPCVSIVCVTRRHFLCVSLGVVEWNCKAVAPGPSASTPWL